MSKLPSSPTLAPSTRQGQAVLALGEPVGLAGTLLGLVEHPIAIGRLRALIVELATSGRLLQRKLQAPRESAIGPASGELPEGWVRLPLSELVVDFQNGIAKRSGDRGTPIAVLRLADITRLRLKETELREIILTPEEQTKYQVDRGDFLVIRVNGSGELVGRFVPCTVQRQWAYSDHLIRVRPRADLVDQRYLCLFANSETARRHLVDKTVTTAGQKTINQGGLGSLPVVVPPIEEQKRIVAKVDQLMALCDDLEAEQTKKRDLATQSTRSALSALAMADTVPDLKETWARVASNFNDLAADPDAVNALRETAMSLGLGGWLGHIAPLSWTNGDEVRAGWWRGTLGDAAEFITSGSRSWKGFYSKSGAVFIRSQDIRSDALDLTSPAFVSLPGKAEGTRTRVNLNDVLVTITGANVGKAAYVAHDVGEAYVSQHVALIRLRDPSLAAWVHRWLVCQSKGRGQLLGVSYGDKPGLNLDNVRSVPLEIPPPGEREMLLARMGALLAVCDDLEAKLRKQEETATRLAESLAAAVAA